MEIWCLTPGATAPLVGEDCLDAGERARAARFRFPEDARLFTAAHVLRRAMLSALGAGPVADLVFGVADHMDGDGGKPVLCGPAGGGWAHNLSHTRFGRDGGAFLGMAACAVATSGGGRDWAGREIGLDVEWAGRRLTPDLVAHSFGSADRAWLAGQPGGEQDTAGFLTVWTLKEAWIKGVGAGLRLPLDGFHIDPVTGVLTLDESRLAKVTLTPGQRALLGAPWRFARFNLPAGGGVLGALALSGAGPAVVRVRQLPDLAAAFDGRWRDGAVETPDLRG